MSAPNQQQAGAQVTEQTTTTTTTATPADNNEDQPPRSPVAFPEQATNPAQARLTVQTAAMPIVSHRFDNDRAMNPVRFEPARPKTAAQSRMDGEASYGSTSGDIAAEFDQLNRRYPLPPRSPGQPRALSRT